MLYFFFLLITFVPSVSFSQGYQPNIPIADGIRDGSQRQSAAGANTCIQAQHDLRQAIEDINGELFLLEGKPNSGYYIRHSDRMAIVSLIQNELTPIGDEINHAIFLGNGNYCLDKLRDGVKLAVSIYQANMRYRKR